MKRLISLMLAAGIISIPFSSYANTENVSPAERTKIETVVHEYLIKNPQVLIEVMQVLQKKQADQAQQTVKLTQKAAPIFAKDLFQRANDPVAGNPNGKVTIVEFFDYKCPHCVEMAPVISSVIQSNPDVRVIYKVFPIGGPQSEFATRAAMAANMQGKYNEFSHAILISGKPLTEEFIFETAKNTGLDVDRLKKDMDSAAVKKQIADTIDLAKKLKLFGTPAIFIGKTASSGNEPIDYIPGKTDAAQIQGLVNKAKGA